LRKNGSINRSMINRVIIYGDLSKFRINPVLKNRGFRMETN